MSAKQASKTSLKDENPSGRSLDIKFLQRTHEVAMFNGMLANNSTSLYRCLLGTELSALSFN